MRAKHDSELIMVLFIKVEYKLTDNIKYIQRNYKKKKNVFILTFLDLSKLNWKLNIIFTSRINESLESDL